MCLVSTCRLLINFLADWKSRITLYDPTTDDGINFDIFLSEDEMPEVQAGDIVIASMVTRQRWGDSPSLLTTKNLTDIHVYDAQRVANCRGTGSAKDALKPPTRKVHRRLVLKEHEYVLWLFHKVDQVPDRKEVAHRAAQTVNIKDKFTLLQNVVHRKFADLVVQVVKEPYDLGDMMTLWVSDYTENSNLFNKTNNNSDWVDGVPIRDGDAYGYTSKFNRSTTSMEAEDRWLGPYGKSSIQLTCWEPHADFIRKNVQVRDWVHLRNVEIGYGRINTNTEGFLRSDREYPNRVYVRVLDPTADRETIDPRLKDAIRRKRDYEKDHKQELEGGKKRKAEAPPQINNSEAKRKRKREEKAKAFQEKESKQEAHLGLNDQIKCEHTDKVPVPLSTILESVRYDTTFELPFTCANYRTQARVVDFHPASLEDFAVGRTTREYDILSENNNDDSDSDSSAANPQRARNLTWEWRFALKLEEVSPSTAKGGKKPASAWVLVDNLQGQLLTDLDALDLRSGASAGVLERLRQRMFILWGDLEEHKSAVEERKRNVKLLKARPDFSDDDHNGAGVAEHLPDLSHASNTPFTCCIRQYGVKVKAAKDEEANAGEGVRWQRVFGLFGIKIASD